MRSRWARQGSDRRWLTQVGVPRLQLGTLRLRVVKIGGWVRERLRGVSVHLASSHPSEPLWRLLAAYFTSSYIIQA